MEVIVTHSGGDFDSLASLVAAKKLYPKASMIMPQSPEKQVRKFLSLYQNAFDFKDERLFNFDKVNRLIIVDTRLKRRLGKAQSIVDRKDVEIHIYDHHPRTEEDIQADQEISRKIGATVTILINEIKKQKIRITPLEATLMCLGIYEDTGSLTFRTTTREDIDAVSFLVSQGADLTVVSHYLNRQLTKEELSILVKLIQKTETQTINGVSVAISSIEYDRYIPDLALLTHRLIDIENFNVIFVLVKIDSKIQLIARSSIPNVDVNKITACLGGGGHPSAASCILREKSLKQAKDKIIKLLKKNIKPQLLAEDVMNKDVRVTTELQTVNKVKRDMIRYNVNQMLISDKGKITGIVTRGDLDKAIYHGFGHSKVKGYMSHRVISVNEKTPISDIKRIFFEDNIGRVPVFKNNKLVGIVTRDEIIGSELKEQTKIAPHLHLQKKNRRILNPIFEDLTSKMKKNMPKEVFSLLKKIGHIADDYQFRVYAVGGMVRDLILDYKNLDIDLVVEGEAIKFAQILSGKIKGKLVTYQRFGTAVLFMSEGFRIDLASSRTEFYEYPAALPTVELSSIKNDLSRRDFTINAMAIGLNQDNFGQLIDFFGGLRDIKEKRIKVLHNLSFVEDPTRIFRAVRFEQRYNFKIDSQTEFLIRTAVDMKIFEKVSAERMREELLPILCEAEPLKAIKRMAQLHELRFIHPRLKLTKPIVKYFNSVKKSLNWAKENLDEPVSGWLIYLCALVSNLDLKEVKKIAQKFAFSREDTEKLISYKKHNKSVLKRLRSDGRLEPSKLYQLLNPYSVEFVLMILSKTNSQRAKQRIRRYLKIYKDVSLKTTGDDLKRLGLKPSPRFKVLLDKLLYAKLDRGFKTKKEELRYLKSILKR